MGKGPKRARTERRANQRTVHKAVQSLNRLAEELPGGSPDRPLTVSSASVIEARARAVLCLACEAALELRAHAAVPTAGEILRAVDLACRVCHSPRRLWFRVVPALPS